MKYTEEQFEQWVQEVFDEESSRCRLVSASSYRYEATFKVRSVRGRSTAWDVRITFNGENADCTLRATYSQQSSIPTILARQLQIRINESLR